MFNKQEIQSLAEENERLKAEITRLSELVSEQEKSIQGCRETIYGLRQERHKMFNSRGAGRKSRITEDILSCIKDLRRKGLSFSKIAANLTETTGTEWSKSTVAYALKSSEN